MQEPPAPPPAPNAGSQPTEQIRPVGLFSDLKYTESLAPRPLAPAPVAKPNKILSRVVLPLVILVVGVAGIAWVTQFLPDAAPPADPNQPAAKLKLQFTTTYFKWPLRPGEKQEATITTKGKPAPKKTNADDLSYIGEYETITNGQQDGGFCDFEFKNTTNQTIELGLMDTYCQCSSVDVALLTAAELKTYHDKKAAIPVPHGTRFGKGIDEFTWVKLKRLKGEDGQAVEVEPGQAGLVRLHWDGRNQDKFKFMRLHANMQMNPKGNSQQFVIQKLVVHTVYVEPVRIDPQTLASISIIQGSGTSQDFTFHCWSATRDLIVEPDTTDPCLTVNVTPLKEPECRALEKTFKERGLMTRIRSAFRVDLKLSEKKDNQQLSLGVFEKPLPVRFKDKHTGEVLPNGVAPVLTGTVRGDLKVNGSSENLKIDLGNFGARVLPKVVPLWTKADVDLQPDPLLEPRVAGISAAVQKAKGGGPGNWEIVLTVSENVVSGPLPQNLVLVLRLKNSAQSIRIPVTGHRSYN